MHVYIPDWMLVVGLATLLTVVFVSICNRKAADKMGVATIYIVSMLVLMFVSIFVADVIPLFSYIVGVSYVTAFETAIYYWI